MHDDKYVVFKSEEFSNWYQTVEGAGETIPMSLDDAIVIRRQDVFAPPALEGYASAITTVVEILKEQNAKEPDPVFASGLEQRIKHLESVADYFHKQSEASWDTVRKIPD